MQENILKLHDEIRLKDKMIELMALDIAHANKEKWGFDFDLIEIINLNTKKANIELTNASTITTYGR